ncbi:MAG: hypothetical protein K2K80_05185 [Clostridia bacterium]|nr:hypothetical protein [Clostridia bacterium]
MSFISFNLNYYKQRIEYYEKSALTKNDIYEAKQLLKLIDDLIDEGYYELSDALQKDSCIVDRLKSVIKAAGEEPFNNVVSDKSSAGFNNEEIELSKYIDNLIIRAKAYTHYSDYSFLTEIKSFCNSIKYDKNCSYIFLLRDTLLPYIFFKNKLAENIYPYLISRSFLNLIYKNGNVDDIVRAVIIKALENGHNSFESYFNYCKREILNNLSVFPKIITVIKDLLSEIKSEKIVVIETGCYGTFPMLLSALDERIEFKMYTTVPYLFQIYKNHIFTTAYENIRLFETLYCQNNLFQLSDFKNNRFYVAESENDAVITKSLQEIGCFLKK